MGQRSGRAAGRSRRGPSRTWPMPPASRLSDPDIMSRYRMTPSRSRPQPGLGIAERCASRNQGAEAKARGATLTFAQRAFAAAALKYRVRAVESIKP